MQKESDISVTLPTLPFNLFFLYPFNTLKFYIEPKKEGLMTLLNKTNYINNKLSVIFNNNF